MKELEVVAALIRRKDREFLICRRAAEKARGLLWEFPGGKVEPGESKAEAIIRECREELDFEGIAGNEIDEVTYCYPELTIHMTLLEVFLKQGEPHCLEHDQIRWIVPEEIPDFEFCPADMAYLDTIRHIIGCGGGNV